MCNILSFISYSRSKANILGITFEELTERTKDMATVVDAYFEKRKEQLEYIKRRQKEEQEDISKRMSEDLAKSAMKNIKQFYKNK